VTQRSEQADRVLDLARVEADLFGHRYLGPEHLVLGYCTTAAAGPAGRWKAKASICRVPGPSWAVWPSGGWCPVHGPATPSC
jgi:hypothetical protein